MIGLVWFKKFKFKLEFRFEFISNLYGHVSEKIKTRINNKICLFITILIYVTKVDIDIMS